MMKISSSLVLVLTWAFTLLPVSAQLPGGRQAGMNAALLKLFGDLDAFSARAEVTYQDKTSRQDVMMPMGFALLDGKLRLDLDLSQMKSAQVPTQMLASLKLAGLDKAVTIVRPDRRMALMVYPGISSYVEMPMAAEEAADWQRSYSVDQKKLGRETIEGKPCDRTRVTVSGNNGTQQEATVWYSQEPRPFPVKVQMVQSGATVTMLFRDVKLTRPDAAQFEAGGGLKKYASVEQLTQSAMMKALGGGVKQ